MLRRFGFGRGTTPTVVNQGDRFTALPDPTPDDPLAPAPGWGKVGKKWTFKKQPTPALAPPKKSPSNPTAGLPITPSSAHHLFQIPIHAMKRITLLSLGAALLVAPATQGADLREGLVSYWPLDTHQVLVWPYTTPDVVAGNNLEMANIIDSSVFVAGKFGNAFNFNQTIGGSEQYLTLITPEGVDNGLPISRSPAWSVLMWVKGNATDPTYANGDKRVFCDSSSVNANPLMAIGTRSGTTAGNYSSRIYIRNSGPLVDRQNSTGPAANAFDGTWRHIALISEPGTVRLYVDGQLDMSNAYTQGNQPIDTTAIAVVYRLVNSPPNAAMFQGAIDDVAVWSRALSEAEILQVMNNSIQTPVPAFAPGFSVQPVGSTALHPNDPWTLRAGVYGTRPMTYQWTKNGEAIPGATDLTLALVNTTEADSGAYALVASNAQGNSTSQVAQVTISPWPAPNLNDSMISYWPLDTILGTKTPDLVSGYDMTLNNLTEANLVAGGRWSKAMQFNGTSSMLTRINNPGEDLPIYQHPNFSVSLWVKGVAQTDRRVFSEGSTTNGNALFNIGTHNTGADGTVDLYIRNNTGGTVGDHRHSLGVAFDDTWHNIIYVQREIAPGTMTAQLYVDGVADEVVITPVRPLTANTTTIGGILRAAASAWYGGLIDEVVLWNRALSAEEAALLQTTYITDPPSRLQPLAITSFKADLPAIASGGSTTLRWEVSKDATQITISSLGDVTAQTSAGAGSLTITPTESTTYVITVNRGADTLTASTSVAVVNGVAPGWTLLDNFDQAQLGNLFDSGYWNDTSGTAGQVVDLNGNRALRTTATGISFLRLRSLSIQENQARTLFFRLIPGDPAAFNMTNMVALTDKSQRSYADEIQNIGPAVYPSPFTNELAGVTTNGWYLGARNGWLGDNTSAAIDFPNSPLDAIAVYNVWINVTNAPLADSSSDTFSVFIQKEGEATRTLLFENYMSDRDPFFVDPVLGGIEPVLDQLVVLGSSSTYSAAFDDFYLSSAGYLDSVPAPYGSGTPPGPLTVTRSGANLVIGWDSGTLEEADSPAGGWSSVQNATPPTHTVTPAATQKYYRARK